MRTEAPPTIHVQFTLNAADWRTVAAEQRRNSLMPRLQNAYMILFGLLALFALGMTAYALVSPVVFPTWPHRRVRWDLVMSTFVTGVVIVLPLLTSRRHLLPPLRAGAAFDLQFGDAGITFGEDLSRFVRWQCIAGARDIDDAIVLSDIQNNVLVLPKRLFPDRGAALWAFLEERLISRRGLIRRSDARRIIFNTRAAD